jgi:hypothetical protein
MTCTGLSPFVVFMKTRSLCTTRSAPVTISMPIARARKECSK